MMRDTYINQVAAPLEGLIREELLGSCDAMIAINDGILRTYNNLRWEVKNDCKILSCQNDVRVHIFDY